MFGQDNTSAIVWNEKSFGLEKKAQPGFQQKQINKGKEKVTMDLGPKLCRRSGVQVPENGSEIVPEIYGLVEEYLLRI